MLVDYFFQEARRDSERRRVGDTRMPLIGVRCTCGKVIGNKEEKARKCVEEKMPYQQMMKELGLTKICCKVAISTYVPVIDTLLKYEQLPREYKMNSIE
jgi:DNA-directed RNA polymerase I, II, and III subunit RPABC5